LRGAWREHGLSGLSRLFDFAQEEKPDKLDNPAWSPLTQRSYNTAAVVRCATKEWTVLT
jgi:hypothetical protein